MTSPLFSVIIPAYNVDRYITLTVESVLAQSVADFELIVVDHGSTDATRARLDEIHDPRLAVVGLPRHPGNATVAHPRNLGIDRSCGRYLAFLDSDDLWETEKLARCLDRLKMGAGVVFSNASVIDETGRVLRRRRLPLTIEGPGLNQRSLLLVLSNPIQTSGVVLDRAFLGERRFDERAELFTSEDALLWTQLNRDREFDYIAEPLVRYRLHGANSSRPFDETRARERFHAVRNAMVESGCIPPKHVDFVRRIDELQFLMLGKRRGRAISGLLALAARSTPLERSAVAALATHLTKLAALRIADNFGAQLG